LALWSMIPCVPVMSQFSARLFLVSHNQMRDVSEKNMTFR
jgi:hypothetical protein